MLLTGPAPQPPDSVSFTDNRLFDCRKSKYEYLALGGYTFLKTVATSGHQNQIVTAQINSGNKPVPAVRW
jgi:hypothetical protein